METSKEYRRHSCAATKLTQSAFAVIASAFLLTAITGCNKGHETVTEIRDGEDSMNVLVKEPVQRDWDAIKSEGVLRVITRYNSNSYFLHRGIEKGFEYEFAKEFARIHGLRLEMVIAHDTRNHIDVLNSGQGDIIAANYSITPERQKYINFSKPYNIVDQVLVVREGSGHERLGRQALERVTVSVREGSSYHKTLRNLQREGMDIKLGILPKVWDSEAILMAVSNGTIEATIVDSNLLSASTSYINGITGVVSVHEGDEIAWGIRKNAGELQKKLDQFMGQHFRISEVDEQPRRSAFLNILHRRYFENRPVAYNIRNISLSGTGYEGVLSPWDELVIPLADSAGVDWKLVIAIMAQESRFDPYAKSWMGAVGLMQIMPRFSQVETEELLFDPKINIREGIRFIKKHLDHYSYLDSDEQIRFALASYNAGMGHVADARRLSIDRNRDPNKWENVEDALLKLMRPHYYQHARHGYVRGTETVNYVSNITNRYNMYQTLWALVNEDPLREHRDLSMMPASMRP